MYVRLTDLHGRLVYLDDDVLVLGDLTEMRVCWGAGARSWDWFSILIVDSLLVCDHIIFMCIVGTLLVCDHICFIACSWL